MVETNRITAEQARAIATDVNRNQLLKRIYKAIAEDANEGRSSLVWCVDKCSLSLIKDVEDYLTKDGYIVERNYEQCSIVVDLIISWDY